MGIYAEYKPLKNEMEKINLSSYILFSVSLKFKSGGGEFFGSGFARMREMISSVFPIPISSQSKPPRKESL